MTCNNTFEMWVPKGYHGSLRPIKCGNTMYNGDRAICDECRGDADRMADINRQEANIKADNEWSHSAGGGDW